jgi:3-hydroxybutyrate dehydrogenase
VNNAGVCDFGQVEWCGVDVYNRLLQVNTLGTIRVTQAFLPLLRKKRGSRVVIVASVAGILIISNL